MTLHNPWVGELPENLCLGTSSFSWAEWNGVFYPAGLPAAERLGWYSTQMCTVEIDSSFYAMPSRATVSGWANKTPDTFRFSLKVPKLITHEHQLEGVEAATAELVETSLLLGPRRGPLLLQFPYVAKGQDADEYEHGDSFRERLAAWLARWAGQADWVVEVRNSSWLRRPLLELLREHNVPLALTAYYTMPSLARLQRDGIDPLTGSFAYVRFIGDHRRLDEREAELVAAGEKKPGFDQLIVDREDDLRSWVDALLPVVARMRVWCYFNNHFEGFGPGSARRFARLWQEIHGTD